MILNYQLSIVMSLQLILLKGLVMNNFDRYLSDINPEILQDIARKRKFKRMFYEMGAGILFCLLITTMSYFVLISF